MSDTLALITLLARQSSEYAMEFEGMGAAELERLYMTLASLVGEEETATQETAVVRAQVLPFPPRR